MTWVMVPRVWIVAFAVRPVPIVLLGRAPAV